MQTIALGGSDLKASSVILGLMRIAKMEDAEIRKLVGAAMEAGTVVLGFRPEFGSYLAENLAVLPPRAEMDKCPLTAAERAMGVTT